MRVKGIRGTKILLVSEPSYDSGEIREFIRIQKKRGNHARLELYRFHRTDGRCTFYAVERFNPNDPRHKELEQADDHSREGEEWFKRCYENTLSQVV